MGEQADQSFPPPLIVGNRVWTEEGYANHGPIDGPKLNIAPSQGGTISAIEKPYYTMDHLLYSVLWDNGQRSKHYDKELFCIGRFQNRKEFEHAINSIGRAELSVGPAGGFRYVSLDLEFDGKHQTVELRDRNLWIGCIEPIARSSGCTILTTKLPKKG